jgi:hypothetical protein
MMFLSERFELDGENGGNPLIVYLGPVKRAPVRLAQRLSPFVGRVALFVLSKVALLMPRL